MYGDWYDVRGDTEAWIHTEEQRSDEFRLDVRALTEAGCDRLKLGWLLQGLRTAASGRECLSRGEVRRIAVSLEQATNLVRRLSHSSLEQVLDGDLALTLAHATLGEVACRLRDIAPIVDHRSSPDRNLWRAAVVQYVRETTGAWHDEEVAGIINLAESPDGPSLQTEGGYTTNAHVQWRGRPQAREFLNPASDRLQELLNEMESELAEGHGN